MIIRFQLILSVLLISFLFSCEKDQIPSDAVKDYVPPETSVVDAQFNFHLVTPGVWRSSQPDSNALAKMKYHGLKTIINLRGDKQNEIEEKKLADDLGLKFYSFPMDSRKEQDPEYLEEILEAVTDSANQPVLVHCLGGKDRTGLIIGLYKKQYLNIPVDEIEKEMVIYGHDAVNYPEVFKALENWKVKKEE